jgi:hypothetical protein
MPANASILAGLAVAGGGLAGSLDTSEETLMPTTWFTDVLPKHVLAALLLWGIAHYFLIGPELAARVVRADYQPICESDFKKIALAAGDDRVRALELPGLDPAKEMALEQLRAFQTNPMMRQLRQMSGELGDVFGVDAAANAAIRQYEKAKARAERLYEEQLARLTTESASRLGEAGSVCGCVADATIDETRRDWAVFSGTLGLIRTMPLEAFDQRMAQVMRAGACGAGKAGAL